VKESLREEQLAAEQQLALRKPVERTDAAPVRPVAAAAAVEDQIAFAEQLDTLTRDVSRIRSLLAAEEQKVRQLEAMESELVRRSAALDAREAAVAQQGQSPPYGALALRGSGTDEAQQQLAAQALEIANLTRRRR
jgi:hypothetical protein